MEVKPLKDRPTRDQARRRGLVRRVIFLAGTGAVVAGIVIAEALLGVFSRKKR